MSYIKQNESGGGGDTYTLKAAQSGPDVDIQLDAAAGADSDVKLKAGTNITLTEASDTITIDAAGGSSSPGGSNGQIQYNDGGSFGGNAAMTFDDTAGAEQVVFQGTSTANPLVRITQAGSGDALIVEDSTNPDSTQFKVTEKGDVTIGTSSENIGKLRISGTSGNRVITSPSGTSNVVFRFQGPSSALEQLNPDFDNGNTMLYNPYVDGEYSFMRRDGTTNQITTSFVISTEDTIKLGLGGENYGTAGQVLTSGGASGAASWTTVSGGGGGMTPPGMPTGNTDVYPEVMGLSNGAMGPYSGGSQTTAKWANGLMRYRPHFFSRTGTIDNVIFNIAIPPASGAGLQTISFVLYESDSNNQPAAVKAKATANFQNSDGAGIKTISWTAMAGKDLNVTKGEMFFCGFHSNFGSTQDAASLSFWNNIAFLGGLGVDFDTSPQAIMTWYPSSTGFAPTTLDIGSVAGDSSGITWPLWMVDYQ